MIWRTLLFKLKYFLLILVIGFCCTFESGCSPQKQVSKSRTHTVSYKKKKKTIKKKAKKKKKKKKKKSTKKKSSKHPKPKRIHYPFK